MRGTRNLQSCIPRKACFTIIYPLTVSAWLRHGLTAVTNKMVLAQLRPQPVCLITISDLRASVKWPQHIGDLCLPDSCILSPVSSPMANWRSLLLIYPEIDVYFG